MKKKKVLHILNDIQFSGAEVMLQLAAASFQQKGIQLHALSTGHEIGNYSEILSKSGYIIHHIPFGKSFSFFKKLYQFLKKEQFDVVHLHTERGFLLYGIITRLAGVKSVVRTVHNVFIYRGLLRTKKILERMIARRLADVQFLSIGASVNEVEEKHLFNKTIIVPNWVDQHKFRPANDDMEKVALRAKLHIADNEFVIVSVGSCSEIKNHHDILRAVAKIYEHYPHILYLHVGKGDLHETEQAFATDLGIRDRVRFMGQLENIREILIASDVFVMSSRHEGLPISLLEALSCGVPSVAYNAHGIKDLVDDGENGFLTDCNYTSLVNAIMILMADQPLRKRMSEKALEKINLEYDMVKSLEKLVKLY
jgi:glycosyltransferase involved in cell wall biosynthesis